MSIRSRFCRTLSKAQDEEMKNFMDAYDKKQMAKAGRVVENLGLLGELQEVFCELPKPPK